MKMKMLRRSLALILLLQLCRVDAQVPAAPPAAVMTAATGPQSAAFFYGAKPPLSDLQAFEIAVVDPEFVADPARSKRAAADGAHELFAHVSLGEVAQGRSDYQQLPPSGIRSENAGLKKSIIDQTAPGWREFFLSQVIAPLWAKGWRGFFIDQLDAYQRFANTDAERAAQVQAMAATLLELKKRYPEARLILDRGTALLPLVAPQIYAVASESVYRSYDAGSRRYATLSDAERANALARLAEIRERYHVPVIALDYVDPDQPGARQLARDTAQKIKAAGFTPWVADGALRSLGVGSVEVIPRTVLVLLDVAKGEDLHTSEAQRFLGIQLNYLGLRYEFVDLNKDTLPTGAMAGRYAGVVTWFRGGVYHQQLLPWLKKRMNEGVPIAIFSKLGFQLTPAAAAQFDLTTVNGGRPDKLTIVSSDRDMIGFEVAPRPDRNEVDFLRLAKSGDKSLLRLADGRGNTYDAAAITSWGGFALAPFVVTSLPVVDEPDWVLQPMKFLQAALRLPPMPVPDVTTEGGRRILMSHMDGDGFPSRAEMPGTPFGVEVLQREIWDKYRLPITISVVEGELSPNGMYPELSAQTQALAKKMFTLPYVEPASHSFSHPFSWSDVMHDTGTVDLPHDGEASPSLKIPNYTFNLQREIKGSMDYINTILLSGGKKAELFFWTGNCVPMPSAIAQTYLDGYLNMNGGDTMITESRNSWTEIAAHGVRKEGWYQVFAPNQDENVYTNNWTGPFYGFERVIETFKLTDEPIRFKPVDIYYHFYAGTKPASIVALNKIHRWAVAQPYTHLFASQYIRKVLDFENTSYARAIDSDALIIRTGKNLRTLRLPPGGAAPSLSASSGLAGVAPGPSGQYLIMSGGEARMVMQPQEKAVIALYEASGAVSDFKRSEAAGSKWLNFTLAANGNATFSVSGASRCSATADGKSLSRAAGNKNSVASSKYAASGDSGAITQFDIKTGPDDIATMLHKVAVQCGA